MFATALVIFALMASGCSDARSNARELSARNLRAELTQLEDQTRDVAGPQKTGAAVIEALSNGSIAAIMPGVIESFSDITRPNYVGMWNLRSSGSTFGYSAVLMAQGESGGGDLSAESSMYTCVEIKGTAGRRTSLRTKSATCRTDIDSLLSEGGSTPVKVNQLSTTG